MTGHPVADALQALGAHHAIVDLFRSIERRVANPPSTKVLAAELDYHPNTLAGRFSRAGLPPLFVMVRRLQLVHLRRLYEADPTLTLTALARAGGWSDAGSLARHLRGFCRQRFRVWRRARTADEELERFLDELVCHPRYAPRWRAFRLFPD